MLHKALRSFGLVLLLITTLAAGAVSGARAQTTEAPNVADTLLVQLDQIEATLNRDGLSEDTFSELRSSLSDIEAKATAQKSQVQPLLQEAKARLEALKPAETKEGEEAATEADSLKTRREELQEQVTQIDAQLKLISSSLVRAEQLNNRITLARQDRFTRQLFERSGTILNPALWLNGLSGSVTTWQAVTTLFSDWGRYLITRAADHIWQVIGVILIVAVVIVGPLRFLLFSGLRRLSNLEDPTALQRSLYACWAVFVYTIVPVLIFLAVILILDNADLMPRRVEALMSELGSVVFTLSLSYGLIRVLLAPSRPTYRLLNISDSDANKLYGIALTLLAIYGFEITLDETDQTLLTPLETTILLSGIASILTAILIWTGQRVMINTTPQHETPVDESLTLPSGFNLPGFLRLLQPFIWIACLVIGLAPILGFVSLGSFLAMQLGRTFIILGLLGIFSALIDNFLNEELETGNTAAQKISRAMGITPKTVNQFSVLFNGLMRILLYVGAALLIFTPWGVESTGFFSSLEKAIFNIQIGDLSISPINIVGALAVFIVTLVLVKSIQRWMEQRLMPATDLDTGLKNSIQTSIGYVGFILAAMLAFSYMGVNLSNIALVAGALSVGIGFGLQSIVNNFVSGLILLVERPIKTGDWVVVGNDQGYVSKISVRATKIETFDRATVIVPNSDLISNRVMNWMHNGSMGRIIVPVGVSYDSDPEQVRDILMRVASQSDQVSSYPSPSVYFMEFGASSLDFELRCFIHDINSSLSAKSDLRFAIFKALKEANIEIPFPQQDVYIRSMAAPNKPIPPELPPETPPTQQTEQTSPKSDGHQNAEYELNDGNDNDSGEGDGDAAATA
ncbi:mechanosensitive ion channel family protein [Cohaesibacter sp. CAU 1516]|uniref:DUF3772 domain-containing protein n=1 Tax=Cohaesibacter sp. CAU 1516 TaxID=2576038 RepID=UPI0010FD11B4|nr:DUF3772 domain-containing protein [Cohaesibacter sp. CAU 1516]TLP46777.1 mechanosensitive ion channel family protein [Cohaesibacter sp. CAU 1516]